MLFAASDTDARANDIKLPRNYTAPHFNFLDLGKAMVLLTTLSAPHNSRAEANGITWPEESSFTSFGSAWPKECNGLVHISCWHQCNGITRPMPKAAWDASVYVNGMTWVKQSCCTSFQLSWPKKCSSVIGDAIGILWYQH